ELKYMYLKAMDEDTLAFKKSMEAKEISKNIIEIPLKIILSSKTIHNIAVQLEPHIKKAVIADYQIARENLLTAINGGINIIESNYSFFGKNPNYINKTRNVLSNIKHYLKSIDTDFQKI
ncbi:MAG: cyclodeaminase/cyclohydrolase family protein, partial [bacterium]